MLPQEVLKKKPLKKLRVIKNLKKAENLNLMRKAKLDMETLVTRRKKTIKKEERKRKARPKNMKLKRKLKRRLKLIKKEKRELNP